jgi:hypothetical protein
VYRVCRVCAVCAVSRYRRMYSYYLMNRTLDMAWLSWFIIGMVWIFGVGAKDCVRSRPQSCVCVCVCVCVCTSTASHHRHTAHTAQQRAVPVSRLPDPAHHSGFPLS